MAGGRSNLTFEVRDAGGSALRAAPAPTSHVLPTAHDMSREHKIISAWVRPACPWPRRSGLCTDEAVNGAAFYVMGFVDGVIARSEAEVESRPRRRRRGTGRGWR